MMLEHHDKKSYDTMYTVGHEEVPSSTAVCMKVEVAS